MQFLSGLFGCFYLKFNRNLKLVATTATNAEIGTASGIESWKNINMIGMLLPAPDRPPALERAIKIHIRMQPIVSMTGLSKGIFLVGLYTTSGSDDFGSSFGVSAGAGSSGAGASPSNWVSPLNSCS